ncbi:MAG: uracil-DNA glycosylase [Candidatus Dependentiae bacterium]|nr:uracil-DNA glycosylase [Candidatus Dependentiae bacterium]
MTAAIQERKQRELDALYAPYRDFVHSPLYIAGCTHIVFGEGNPNARIMFVGEAPGREEDIQARPFVGRSGKLLDRALELSGLSRSEVYITNIVKCRPPQNRTPFPQELRAGRSLLLKQIETIDPAVICTLGNAALHGLTETAYRITLVHGQPLDFGGRILLPTFHPAHILRNKNYAQRLLADIKKLLPLAQASTKKAAA